MSNVLEHLIERMIGDGIITDSELEARIEEARKESPINAIQETIGSVKEKTEAMQEVDDFSMQKGFVLDEKTVGMQEIDDFTLQMVFEMQAQIAMLQKEVEQLKSGGKS